MNLNENGPEDGGLMVLKGSAKLFKEFFDIEGRSEIRTWGPVDWYGTRLYYTPPAAAAVTGRARKLNSGFRLPQALPRSSSSGSTTVAVNGSRSALNLETLFSGTLGECFADSRSRSDRERRAGCSLSFVQSSSDTY